MQKRKPWRSKKYLTWVKEQACCYCEHPGPVDPHHIQGTKMGGMGTKVPDHMVIPLCRACHTGIHGSNWPYKSGVADTLWEAQQCLKTLHRALQEGVLVWAE